MNEPCNCSEPPGLVQKAANAAAAAARIATAGAGNRFVSSPEKAARLAICNACEHLVGTACQRCGCFVTLKTMFKTEDCPEGKWNDL